MICLYQKFVEETLKREETFGMRQQLWPMGVVLQCSNELLDPAITEVFNEACGGES